MLKRKALLLSEWAAQQSQQCTGHIKALQHCLITVTRAYGAFFCCCCLKAYSTHSTCNLSLTATYILNLLRRPEYVEAQGFEALGMGGSAISAIYEIAAWLYPY
jgi:hypothetical protein